MNHLMKYVSTIFYTIIFLLGISSSGYQIKSYLLLYEEHKRNYLDSIIYEAPYLIEEDRISSATLISTLFFELEYDIQINEQLISKTENGIDYIAILSQTSKVYHRSYIYDNSGTITRIVYKEIQVI